MSLYLTSLSFVQSIRAKMREMGTLAGVPIEPPEQTKLLNTCVCQAGVIAGGVPGGAFPCPYIAVKID
jgi:phosphomevalonate kinase